MSTFITNHAEQTLEKRISKLIKVSKELKVLTAFFYFSGLQTLYESLKKNDQIELKILVGLNVDKTNKGLVEISLDRNRTIREKIEDFLDSVLVSLNAEDFDKKEVYRELDYFLNLIKKEKLIIRKTSQPNHAKLYIFITKKDQAINKVSILGSSNLTKAGLIGQQELNVELPEIYTDKAEKYFDDLWENSIQITENEEFKNKLIKLIREESFLREITPFEAYFIVIKNYIESYQYKDLSSRFFKVFEKNGYKKYTYQLDAIKQALLVIEKYKGIILADVVGLGKTIMACSIAKELGVSGIIICPPGLKGDFKQSDMGGWNMYKRKFGLTDWEVWSLGDLNKLQNEIRKMPEVQAIIIDEAHRFRNEDTQNYEYLKNICRGKKVILLTATPFNNKPSDILSLIKLFIPPKQSFITLDENLENKFSKFETEFKKLGFILKNSKQSLNSSKYKKALNYYKDIFNENISKFDFDFIKKIKMRSRYISYQIKSTIEPITIRRNRLDLVKNSRYQNEITNLSKVENPIEWFYELTNNQSEFYDKVVGKYFADPEEGVFKGAIYRPFVYEAGLYGQDLEEGQLEEKENRAYIQQKNLYDFMRRLLVKRFESSFGAFKQSIINFKNVIESALDFINNHKKFILDRELVLKLTEMSDDEVEEELINYQKKLKEEKRPKHDKIYYLENFKQKELFLKHIKSDLELFKKILKELDDLKLIEDDPKTKTLYEKIKEEFNKKSNPGEPKRKIVIFSEYLDTVKYLSEDLSKKLNRILVVEESLSNNHLTKILENFDASYKNKKDDYDILLTSDKLSEGFNLNRAGMIINYDIPWNPVRVIQRLGRINRIGQKIYDNLYIVNFFPTEKGANVIRSREIASQKMFLIHNTLGEDSKIFDIEEEPKPSNLYAKLNQNPENNEQENFYTKVFNIYEKIKNDYSDLIDKLNNIPLRIKVSKKGNKNELFIFIRKNNQLYVKKVDYKNEFLVEETNLEEVLKSIECKVDERSLNWDTDDFWFAYEKALKPKSISSIPSSELSLERKSLNLIDTIIRDYSFNLNKEMIRFIKNLREDIISYGTLSKTTLRTIINLPINDLNKLQTKLVDLAYSLGGYDYLEKEKKYLPDLNKEVIVAIENKNI